MRAPLVPRLDEDRIRAPIRILVVATGRAAVNTINAIARRIHSSGNETFLTTLPADADASLLEKVLGNASVATVVLVGTPPPRWVASRFDLVMSSPAACPEAMHRCAFHCVAPDYAAFERWAMFMPRDQLIVGDFRQGSLSSGARVTWYRP